MQYLLAHDLGTSGNKATLYDTEGNLVKSCIEPYNTRFFNGNWAEQNPSDWWRAVCDSTQNLLQYIEKENIAAVSFSGQMMGCLCIDINGRPLRPHILYCDQRAQKQTDEILQKIEAYDFFCTTGHRCSPVYSIQKLMWVKENEPEIYKKTFKMLNAKDYIAYLLTGNIATDYSDAVGSTAFDINKICWSERILKIADVDAEKLPEAHASTHILGEVTREAAQETGIPAGVPVVIGAGDGVAAGVGAGSVKIDRSYSYIGSSSWMATTSKKPMFDPKMRTNNWIHAVPGMYHPCGSMQAAGSCYAWAKDHLAQKEALQAEQNGLSAYALMDKNILKSPPGAKGLYFLPYLMGERTPYWNPDAKGAFIGLKLTNTHNDMLRAVLEGVTYNMRSILEVFRENGLPISDMSFVGGGANGKVWRQMMADIYDMEIKKPRDLEECTSLGAAVIGGVGVGVFKDFSAVKRFVEIEEILVPNKDNAAFYKEKHKIFLDLYKSLECQFPKL